MPSHPLDSTVQQEAEQIILAALERKLDFKEGTIRPGKIIFLKKQKRGEP